MKNTSFIMSAMMLAGLALVPVQAKEQDGVYIVKSDCASVLDADGCLFNGNIGSPNSIAQAETAYNRMFADRPISLTFIAASDDRGFGDFGAVFNSSGKQLGSNGGFSAGSWSMPGWSVDYISVKAGDTSVLYHVGGLSNGLWDTLSNPFHKNPKDMSHISFFGSKQNAGGNGVAVVPEPATWAMLIAGFGLVGLAMRRRRNSGIVRVTA